MGKVKSGRPSAAMIVAMIALSLALGGSAIAADALTKSDVKKLAKKQAGKQIKRKVTPTLPIAFGFAAEDDASLSNSENLRSAKGDAAGRYCFEVLNGSPRNVQATVDWETGPAGAGAPLVSIPAAPFDCPSSADEFSVQTYNAADTISDMAVYVLVR